MNGANPGIILILINQVNLILAAGTQERWNYGDIIGLPKLKQLVDVEGIPLIIDIQHKFPDSIVVTNNYEIKKQSMRWFVPEHSEVTLGTLFSTRDFWQNWTTILLGDVLYGRQTRKLLKRQTEPLMFYGDMGEIYAIKFKLGASVAIIAAISKIINSPNFKPKYGKLWNLYRELNGIDFRHHEIDEMFTRVGDCRDFDNKEQYLKYAKDK